MSVQIKIDNLGKIFGGYEGLNDYLTVAERKQIASFPGEIVLTTISSLISPSLDPDDINLVDLGYIPQSTYYVYNRQMELLYANSCSVYLGENQADKDLGYATEHAAYYYVLIKTLNGDKVFLLWLTSRLSPVDRESALKSLATDIGHKQTEKAKQIESELFIYNQTSEDYITVYLLPGNLQVEPRLVDIVNSPLAKQFRFKANKGQLFKNLTDKWIVAVTTVADAITGEFKPTKVWKLANAFGSGIERIFRKESGLSFIGANTLNRINLTNLNNKYTPASLIAQVYLEYAYAYINIENFRISGSGGILIASATGGPDLTQARGHLTYSSLFSGSAYSYRFGSVITKAKINIKYALGLTGIATAFIPPDVNIENIVQPIQVSLSISSLYIAPATISIETLPSSISLNTVNLQVLPNTVSLNTVNLQVLPNSVSLNTVNLQVLPNSVSLNTVSLNTVNLQVLPNSVSLNTVNLQVLPNSVSLNTVSLENITPD